MYKYSKIDSETGFVLCMNDCVCTLQEKCAGAIIHT